MRWLMFVACAVTVLGCRQAVDGDRALIEIVPSSSTAVVMITPPALVATWAEPVITALAQAIAVPLCVVTRARHADRVIAAWIHMLPADGWMIGMVGGADPPCPELERHGVVAVWSRDLAPRTDDDPGFFADRTRQQRWQRLRKQPVRSLVDTEISPGVTARGDIGLAVVDGIDARATIHLDADAAAFGLRQRFDRWRADADAWPAIAAITASQPVLGQPELTFDLRLPGSAGAEAAPLLAMAFVFGGLHVERPRCPAPGLLAGFGLRCSSGEVQIPLAQGGRVLDHYQDGTNTIANSAGPIAIHLGTIGARSSLRALGFRDRDSVRDIDGKPVSGDELTIMGMWLEGLVESSADTTSVVHVLRGGRSTALRFRLIP
jgi:hypothetical protein